MCHPIPNVWDMSAQPRLNAGRCLFCYMWNKCEVSSSRKRGPSQEMDFCVMILSCVEKLHSSLETDHHPTSTVDPDHWLPAVQPIMSPMTPQLPHTVSSHQPASSTYPSHPVAFVYNDTMLLIDSPSTSQTSTEMGSTTARTSQFSPITIATALTGQYLSYQDWSHGLKIA